ncbi:hypothetical protein HMPREF3227_02623 [Corynebacterium sp. CMW7794]|nr:hypothetical protein HMPREF0307_02552 [Corynebacterium sp. DNF00584]KXI14999.1 hypothetical protein HMPREF3227_02623 [Corynebacterium sp. CMW7794]
MCSRRRDTKPFNEDSKMPSALSTSLAVAAAHHNRGIEERFPEVAVCG